jgi:anti-sigma regulatory factor (Ser/Thr protein kinase)
VVFEARIDRLESMFAFIREAARRQGFDDAAAGRIQLACEEALVNVINYAYPEKTGTLSIECANEPGRLVITISDAGVAFDPLTLPEPDINAPIEQRKVGGLGIFMMRRIMDTVTYRREGDRNVLTLEKRL